MPQAERADEPTSEDAAIDAALGKARVSIDELDAKLAPLIAERVRIGRLAAELRPEGGSDPERERVILERSGSDAVRNVYGAIFAETRGAQPGMDGAKWTFDARVAEDFDEILARSTPSLAELRRVTLEIARPFLAYSAKKTVRVLDIGAARGDAIDPLIQSTLAGGRYTLLEMSSAMLAELRARYAPLIDARLVDVRAADLREPNAIPNLPFDFVLSVYTLQFVPIEYRAAILATIAARIPSGGAFLLAEKVLVENSAVNQLLVGAHYDRKRDAGYTDDQIRRKALGLEGVLVPLSARANESMLYAAGFGHVECVWRTLNFAAWLALRT